MKLEKISLENFRGFEQLDLEFHESLNVIVGINGAGKSTILDACAILLSNVVSHIKKDNADTAIKIVDKDIHNQYKSTKIETEYNQKSWNVVKNKTGTPVKEKSNFVALKEYTREIQENISNSEFQCPIPCFVYYGTNRVVLDIPQRVVQKHNFDLLDTYENSLKGNADFRLFFEWFRDEEDYENEQKLDGLSELADKLGIKNLPNKSNVAANKALSDLLKLLESNEKSNMRSNHSQELANVKKVLSYFLPEMEDFRIRRKKQAMVATKNGVEIEINQLSDGEKNLLALVGDLARRLTMANPTSKDPLKGEGVVLIDEIELHLHPTWQREIVGKLKDTFPNCQFIITTHSPQVIGEVPTESLFLLRWNQEEKQPSLLSPSRSIGLSSSEVMSEIMDSPVRNRQVQEKIDKAFDQIDEENFDEAEKLLDELDRDFGVLPETLRARGYLSVFS